MLQKEALEVHSAFVFEIKISLRMKHEIRSFSINTAPHGLNIIMQTKSLLELTSEHQFYL